MKFVIEHLEPKLYQWCFFEYKHISKIVGKNNLIFTNINSLKLKKFGKVRKESVTKLKLHRACTLDPSANQTLTPKIAKEFDYFIFGGILGDNPQKFRTKIELTTKLKLPAFNLGKEQMSTDTAVYVVKKMLRGKTISDLKFVDEIEFKEKDGSFVCLPYRYVVEKGKPIFAPGLKEFVLKQKTRLV